MAAHTTMKPLNPLWDVRRATECYGERDGQYALVRAANEQDALKKARRMFAGMDRDRKVEGGKKRTVISTVATINSHAN